LKGKLSLPPFLNVAGEVRVRELDIFKPKRSIPKCTHKSGFKMVGQLSERPNGRIKDDMSGPMRNRSFKIKNLSSLEAT